MSETQPEATAADEPSVPTDRPSVDLVMSDLEGEWPREVVEQTYRAERAAQARRCRVPSEDEPWPPDLLAALLRRVAHALAMRNKPLGLESSVSEVGVGFARVGGMDAEVRRLEAPHRKVVVG